MLILQQKCPNKWIPIMNKKQIKRILIKISGASIKSKDNNIFDLNYIKNLAKQIAILAKKYQIGIVIGGGNIWRGNMTVGNVFKKANADYMGMLSTIINALAFKDILVNYGCQVNLYSALAISNVTKPIVIEKINNDLNKKKVAIFAAGTGHPYFTTDTGCVIWAIDMDADVILMGKDSVDGVFSDDPQINKKAKFYSDLKFIDVLKKKLKVMDLSALTLCEQHDIDIYVFNILQSNSLLKIINKKCKFTHIHK